MDGFGIPYYDFGVELSSPCRGVIVWALIREIGVEGMRQRVKRHRDMALSIAQFADNHPNLEVVSYPVLSICYFRYVSPQVSDLDCLNQRIYHQLIKENEYLPSTTRVRGILALRPCYIGARADHEQVKGLLDAVLRIGKEIEAEG